MYLDNRLNPKEFQSSG